MLCPCSIHPERRLRNRMLDHAVIGVTATFTPSFPLLARFGVGKVVRELAPKPPEWTSSTRPHWLTAIAAQPQSAPPPTDSTNYLCPTNSDRAAVEIASAPFSDGLTCMCRPQTKSQVRCDNCHSITGTRPSRCWSAAVMLVLVVITGIPAVLGYAAYLTQG
jgi:hypothetical protein